MAQRKSESFDERREQIMAGALSVFSHIGFARATNRDVARAAGIQSPALIYHYFADKAELLRAVVERYAPPLQLLGHSEEIMALPPHEALPRFALAYLQLLAEPQFRACLQLLLAEALHHPEFAHTFAEAGPIRFWRLLATYLERWMDAGALRRQDAAIAAQCFLGPLALQLLTRALLDVPTPTAHMPPEALVSEMVDVYLRGMQATAGETAE